MRRYPEIEKLAAGHYRLTGNPTLTKSKDSTNLRKIRGATRMRPKRGETTRRILKTLLEAGGSGIAARDIAKKIGSHYRNVHVWFASTGKKTNQVERIARGIYRIKQSGDHKDTILNGN